MKEIYLDNAATTKPYREVIDAISRVMSSDFANPSSIHARGLRGARHVDLAKQQVLGFMGSQNWDVIFTSGGSESDSLAVLGMVPKGRRDTVVTSMVEHAATEDACKMVESRGGRVFFVSAGQRGVVDPKGVGSVLDERTGLVSITHVANEMGTIQPVNQIARLVKHVAPRAKVHVDAVQAAAQLSALDYVKEVDLVSISAHKIHGPQGVGALLVRPGIRPRSIICGGDQQGGIRPGTLNLPGIVGFGVAAEITSESRVEGVKKMAVLKETFVSAICDETIRALGDPTQGAPGLIVVAVDGVKSEVLLHTLEMNGVIASAGSACHASRSEPPRCLVHAGLRPDQGAVRFSLSFNTTQQEIDDAAGIFRRAVAAVRAGKVGAV